MIVDSSGCELADNELEQFKAMADHLITLLLSRLEIPSISPELKHSLKVPITNSFTSIFFKGFEDGLEFMYTHQGQKLDTGNKPQTVN